MDAPKGALIPPFWHFASIFSKVSMQWGNAISLNSGCKKSDLMCSLIYILPWRKFSRKERLTIERYKDLLLGFADFDHEPIEDEKWQKKRKVSQ